MKRHFFTKKVRLDVRQLKKILEYFKNQESLRYENLTKHLCKIIFISFSLPRKILYKQKVKQITELARTL